jgi:hypothetical protein
MSGGGNVRGSCLGRDVLDSHSTQRTRVPVTSAALKDLVDITLT